MTFAEARIFSMVIALGLGACQDLTPVPAPEAGPDDASTDDSSTDDSSTDDSSTDDANTDDASTGDVATE